MKNAKNEKIRLFFTKPLNTLGGNPGKKNLTKDRKENFLKINNN